MACRLGQHLAQGQGAISVAEQSGIRKPTPNLPQELVRASLRLPPSLPFLGPRGHLHLKTGDILLQDRKKPSSLLVVSATVSLPSRPAAGRAESCKASRRRRPALRSAPRAPPLSQEKRSRLGMRSAWHKQPQEERAAGGSLPTTPPALQGGPSEGAGGGRRRGGAKARKAGGREAFKWIKKGAGCGGSQPSPTRALPGLLKPRSGKGAAKVSSRKSSLAIAGEAAVRLSPGARLLSGSKWPGGEGGQGVGDAWLAATGVPL